MKHNVQRAIQKLWSARDSYFLWDGGRGGGGGRLVGFGEESFGDCNVTLCILNIV